MLLIGVTWIKSFCIIHTFTEDVSVMSMGSISMGESVMSMGSISMGECGKGSMCFFIQ